MPQMMICYKPFKLLHFAGPRLDVLSLYHSNIAAEHMAMSMYDTADPL